MKMKLLLFLVVLTFQQMMFSQVKLVQQSLPLIYDFDMIDDNLGYAVALNALLKTTDGGADWDTVSAVTTANMRRIFCLDQNNFFIAGEKGRFVKSTDAGASWTVVIAGDTLMSAYGINFSSVTTGHILFSSSSAAKAIKTTDGGATWTTTLNHTTGDLEDMDFYDAGHGVVCGGGVGKIDLFYTADGTTWAKSPNFTVPPGYTRSDIRGVKFASANIVYGIGWGSIIGLQASITIKSTDAGATWTYLTQAAENRVYENMYGIYFKDVNNGVAIGGGSRGTVFLKTSDGGVNWIPNIIPSGASPSKIYGNGNLLLIGGGENVFLRSTDYGVNWKIITPVPSSSLYTIHFPDANTGYTAGYNGLMLKTTDGGASWKPSYASSGFVSPNVQGIYFVSANIGYAAYSYGMVTKTTNGGESWVKVIPDTLSTTATWYAPYFINENLGYVVGRVTSTLDVIAKTQDGGQTWEKKTGLISGVWRGVAFYNEQKGIVVGEKLKAAYTNNGGSSWQISTFTTIPAGYTTPHLKDIAFIDENTAIAVGDSIVLKTTDGGATWNFIPVPELHVGLTGVSYKKYANGNPGTIFASGMRTGNARYAGFYSSTDLGVTWVNTVENVDINNTLYDVSSTENQAAYVSSSGSIVYSNVPIVGIGDNNASSPDNYYLAQNYPNPFNPSTRISFSVPADLAQGQISSLRIYDVLGREVATLHNGPAEPGMHTVIFEANSLSSGIYICRFISGGYNKTIKMTLLK